MPACVVRCCKNHSGKDNKSKGITFHRFPSANETWRNDWIQIIRESRNQRGWIPSKFSVVCNSHFEKSDLYTTAAGRLRIVTYAVPKKGLKPSDLSCGTKNQTMQLIVDAAAAIDIKNMSTMNEESLNEKFSTKIIENFSNNGFTKVEEVKDRVSGFVETTKESIKNEETDEECEDNKHFAMATDGEEQKRDGVIDKAICLDYYSNLNNCQESIKEVNDVDSSENNDNKANEEKDLESKRQGTQDIKIEQNVENEHNNALDNDAFIIISSSFAEKFEFIKEEVDSQNSISMDYDDKTNDSTTETQSESQSESIISVSRLKTVKEEQNSPNDDNIIIVDSQIQNKLGLNSNAIKDIVHHTTVELVNDISKEDDKSNSEFNAISELQMNDSQNNVESNNTEDCDKDSVIEIDQMEDVTLEPKPVNFENTAAKIVNNNEMDCTEKSTIENVEEKNGEDIGEKLDNKNKEEKKKLSLVSKLSNTLDILSDDDDEKLEQDLKNEKPPDISEEKHCINLVDDDDIMLVGEETSIENNITSNNEQVPQNAMDVCDLNEVNKLSYNIQSVNTDEETGIETSTDSIEKSNAEKCDTTENVNIKPLLPSSFLKTCKKNFAEMSREDLEEFCILKIVESVVDRSSLGDIRTQLKNLVLTVEEYKKKALMLTKQNRDLQVVLKSIQEEQKKGSVYPVTPLKITRSVGMQVFMADKPNTKRKNVPLNTVPSNSTQNVPSDKPSRNTGSPKTQKNLSQQIPVPRLVPASNTSSNKSNTTQCTTGKSSSNNLTLTNGKQKPEKRSRVQSLTVDLTDDEPPSKISTRSSPVPPVRLVPAQNLLAPQRPQFPTSINSPRKVYIPISGPQAQTIKPGQTIMLKSVTPSTGPKQKGNNNLAKMQSIRPSKIQYNRHPAPLPDVMKQYQPPNWKALPPAPDLKLSKVENGIVISWRIEGYLNDSYEEITSYQLYAYQETQCPPSTALWKKIGDVKALPLPMACTLTQFMTGHKYYFAVRAVDIKSRFGPFSIPGSIILLNNI